ncbi:MAG: hypothetical protein M3083_02060 [Actinomycetota bacterium]|nr:hypothetical protein [Actinomycetota bacterium]
MHPGQLTGPADVHKPGGAASRLAQVSAQLIALAPVGCAALYLLWIVAHFPRIISDIRLNPDASWAPVLARDLGTGRPGGHILVGTASHFATIWLLVLTRGFPFRDALWDVAPFVTFLVGLGIVAWAGRRIAGTWPALLIVAIGLSVTAPVLLTVMSAGNHGATYVADGVLAAFLVFWTTRSRDRVGWARVAVVVVTILVGTTLVSDPLFLPSGLGPFLGAPVALFAVTRNRKNAGVALVTMGITAASVVLALVVNLWMQSLGFQRTYETGGYKVAPGRVAVVNFQIFGHQLLELSNSAYSTQRSVVSHAAYIVMALFVAGALVVPFVLLARCLRTKRQWSNGIDEARFLYVAYWVLSGLAVCVAFSFSAFAEGPSDTSRYVSPAIFALAATAPVWAARADWRRVLVALGATLFCLLSIAGRQRLFAYEIAFARAGRQGPNAIAFLESQGVTNGYTDYFDSHPLTLQADMRVHFYPVIACRTPVSHRLCPFFVNTRTNWYVPRPGTRTFLLFDPATSVVISASPTADLGRPMVVRRFGQLYVYIYGYDVASKFAPPCPADSANQYFCPKYAG